MCSSYFTVRNLSSVAFLGCVSGVRVAESVLALVSREVFRRDHYSVISTFKLKGTKFCKLCHCQLF